MILRTGIIEYLKKDEVLATILSSMHAQVPSTSTVAPYIYMHLHSIEGLKTFGKLFSRVHMICYVLSEDLEEIATVSSRIKEVLDNFFIKDKKYPVHIFLYHGYRITYTPKRIFRSALSFEVLTRD